MADCKSTDTHEGECIGKVAQDNLEQFEDTLYDKHALFFWHNFGFFLNQVGKRLLKEDQKQRNAEHDGKNSSAGNCMTGNKKSDAKYCRSVEYKSCHSVGVEPGFFNVMHLKGIDDVENHAQKNDSHAKADGNNKYGIQFSDKRYGRHTVYRS